MLHEMKKLKEFVIIRQFQVSSISVWKFTSHENSFFVEFGMNSIPKEKIRIQLCNLIYFHNPTALFTHVDSFGQNWSALFFDCSSRLCPVSRVRVGSLHFCSEIPVIFCRVAGENIHVPISVQACFHFPVCHAPWCSAICPSTVTKPDANMVQGQEKTNLELSLHMSGRSISSPTLHRNTALMEFELLPERLSARARMHWLNIHYRRCWLWISFSFRATSSFSLINGDLPC